MIRRRDHTLRRHRHDLPIQAAKAFLAVHRRGAGNQFTGIDHMRRSAGMHHQSGFGQMAQQRPGAPGMIEMHMGHHHITDLFARDPFFSQYPQDPRHAMGGTHIHQGGLPSLDDQVAGVESRSAVTGVNGGYAVTDVLAKRVFHDRYSR